MLILVVMFFGFPQFWLATPPEAQAAAEDAWYVAASGTYKYRKKLTLEADLVSGSTDLTNFPVLVAFTDTDLKTTGNGGDVTDANGYDIVFTTAVATPALLDHEIEKFTASTGEIAMWVEIPTLGGATDTDIYMYYGNSSVSSSQENITGVWDSSYVGVWHMKETSGAHQDSTSNNNDSTTIAVTTQGSATGQVDGADDFELSSGNEVDIGDSNSLDITSAWTLSAWINQESQSTYDTLLVKSTGADVYNYFVAINNDEIDAGFTVNTAYRECQSTAANLAVGTWYHVTATFDNSGNAMAIYKNGASQSVASLSGSGCTTTSDPATNTGVLVMGEDAADTQSFDGLIDEVRISSSVRSADWIKTEYDNMANQGTGAGKFIKTLGSEQAWVNSTGSSDTSWVKGGATGSNIALTVNNSTNSATTIQWIKITRPSSNYTMTAGSATGWSAAVTSADVTFTGSTIAANASTAFTVTATIGSSDEAQTAWTIDVDDATDGASSTSTVASSANALKTGIDATAPTVTMSGVTVNSDTQITATANTATDASSGLHSSAPYWFDETSGGSGATDSTAWQSAVTFADTGLSAGTQYCYRVKARDAVSNESSYTSTSCGTTTGSASTEGGSSGVPGIVSGGGVAVQLPPLEISDVVVDASVDVAMITFITSRPASSYVEYGLTNTYGSSTPKNNDSFQKHTLTVSALLPRTAYHFRVTTEDSQGKVVASRDTTFLTLKAPKPGMTLQQVKDEQAKEIAEEAEKKVEEEKAEETKKQQRESPPPKITGVSIIAVRPTSAKIAWKTDIPATSQVFFGERPKDLNQITIEYATLVTEHSVTISDLTSKTAYYFTAVSRSESGVEATSPESSFTTESLEIQTVVDIAKPVPLPPGSPGTQSPKTAAGETVTVIPILSTPGDVAPPEVVLLSFAKNPTQETSPLIRGRARDARGVIASIAYSTDNGATWHPIDDTQGIGSSAAQFSARIPHLQEGEYSIVFRARDNSGNTGKSDARSLVIDIKPPRTGANAFTLGTQVITPSAHGVLTTLAGITQRIMLSAVGGATAVQVTTDGASFPLTYSKTDNLWFGDITLKRPGTYHLSVTAVDGAGRMSQREINTVKVASPGTITDSENGTPIAGVRVSLYNFSPELNDFVLWPGDIFNQANPAITGEDGAYRFLVPVGRYYIKAEKEGYKPLYTQIRDFPNHSALSFTIPMRRRATVSLPLGPQGHITLPGLPDFLGHTRVSASPDTASDSSVGASASLIDALAPPFSLSDSTNQPVDIRYLRGKKTVLTAWATWSPLAQIQVPVLDALVREDSDNVNVLLLSSQESRGVVETYLRRGNYDLRSVIDQNGDLLDLYGITTLPQHFFLDRRGIVRGMHTGFMQKEQLQKALRDIP